MKAKNKCYILEEKFYYFLKTKYVYKKKHHEACAVIFEPYCGTECLQILHEPFSGFPMVSVLHGSKIGLCFKKQRTTNSF